MNSLVCVFEALQTTFATIAATIATDYFHSNKSTFIPLYLFGMLDATTNCANNSTALLAIAKTAANERRKKSALNLKMQSASVIILWIH